MKEVSQNSALITDPAYVFIALVLVVCGTLYLLSRPRFSGISEVLPAPIWIYAIPVFLSSFNVLPSENAAYSTMSAILVPVSLFLLTISSDFRSTFKIGHLAGIMLVAATSGMMIGGFVSYITLHEHMPDETWRAFGVIAASWIGGSANAVAVQQGLDVDPSILGPLLIMDNLVGYGWIAMLLLLSAQQPLLSRVFRYDPEKGFDVSAVKVSSVKRTETSTTGLAATIGLAFLFGAAAIIIGNLLPEIGDPKIVTATTWSILLIVALGVGLSFSPLRQIEAHGASDIGLVLILLLLASLGARADLSAFFDTPIYFLAGIIWLCVHIMVLGLVARLFKVPPALFAISSAANMGGFVTAPIVATAYVRSFVPTALLMAAIAQIAGIYLPFLLASILAAWAG